MSILATTKRSLLALVYTAWCVSPQNTFGSGRDTMRFQRIGLKEGLSSAIANTIVQDDTGFLWIGTQEGLDRYDGYRLEHFQHDPDQADGISDNHVFTLYLDRDGSLWVGTDGGGLNHYQGQTGRFTTYHHDEVRADTLSKDDIRAILRDGAGRLWVGTSQGLNRMASDGTFQRYLGDEDSACLPPDTTVSSLLQDTEGTLWVGTRNGLAAYVARDDCFQMFYPAGGPDANAPANHVTCLLYDKAGRLWVGTENGLYVWERLGGFTGFHHRAGDSTTLTDNHITALLEDSRGKMWVGTNQGGLNLFDRATRGFTAFTNRSEDPDSLSHNHVHSIFEDRSGVLWVGTTDGLNRYNSSNDAFQDYRQVPGDPRALGGRLVWSIYQEAGGDLWVGTDSGLTLYHGDDPAVHFRHDPDNPASLSHDAVRHIYEDRRHRLWVATRGGGLNLMHRDTGTFTRYLPEPGNPKALAHRMVWRLFEDSKERFWVGTAGGGLALMDREAGTFQTYRHDPEAPGSLAADQVSSFLEDGLGNFWIGTFGGGLDRLDFERDSFRHHRHREGDTTSLTHDRVLSIHQTPNDKTIWIGTWGGLNRLDETNLGFRGYRQKDGLPSEVVYGILSDEAQMLWLSTNKGLCKFDPNTEHFQVYTVSDGLPSSEFNSGAYYKNLEGRMYFGGIDGLAAFYPRDVLTDQRPPSVVVTDLFLDNLRVTPDPQNGPLTQPISATQTLTLDSGRALVSFEFAALHFAAPERNTYAYKLEGYSEKWLHTQADRRFATYSKLKHGRYRFLVKGANKDGVWSSPVGLNLVIRPPAYLSAWAITLYILVSAAVLGALFTLSRRKAAFERRVQARIRESEERLKFALWGSGDEHWDWDLVAGTIYRSNQSGLLPFPEEQTQADIHGLKPLVHPKDFAKLEQAWQAHISGRTPYFECAYRVKGTRGDWLWVLDRGKIVGRDADHNPLRISGTIKDISKLKETEDKLRLIAIAFENTSDGVFITDGDLHLVAVNQAYTHITGRKPEEVLGKPFQVSHLASQDEAGVAALEQELRTMGQWHGELSELRKNGETYQQELMLDMVRDQDGETCHYVGVFSDITFRKKAEEELRHMANYDLLTNLPNRTLFAEHLDQAIQEAIRCERRFGMLFIDLDNFKNINDSLGHSIGDLLLIEVGKRLNACIRAEDITARFGGDEFSVLLKEIQADYGAAKVAEKILSALSEPFDLDGHNIVISPSIGIVLYPGDGTRPEELLRNADTAMYHAKGRGKNNYQFFTEEMNQKVLQRLRMEADLRIAIDRRELTVHFQPKVRFADGDIVGMEALVRWNSAKHGGFVSPGHFITVAEETGLVVPLGKQVLEMTCALAKRWVDEGLLRGRVAVNLSALQFRQKDLLKFIDNTLAETGLGAENLELEITEGTLMENADSAVELMHRLRERGIHLAIDDFGTGFSSLSYLRRFPVTSLKVDRSFVIDMAKRDDDRSIVSSIIGLAHHLGLKVVAEGVETYEQVHSLKEMGCEEMQGFLFSKPLPPDAFEALLRKRPNLFHSPSHTEESG